MKNSQITIELKEKRCTINCNNNNGFELIKINSFYSLDSIIQDIKKSPFYSEDLKVCFYGFFNVDFNNWNSLKDFIESKENIHINLMVHIDNLRLLAFNIIKSLILKKV